MKKLLPLLTILFCLNAFSQDVGRIRQGTTCIVWYELKGDNYDIWIRNAYTEPSVIEAVFNDSVFTKILYRWEKYHWTAKGEFTLFVRNLKKADPKGTHECGSKRQVDHLKWSRVVSPLIVRYSCDGWGSVEGFPVRNDNTERQ